MQHVWLSLLCMHCLLWLPQAGLSSGFANLCFVCEHIRAFVVKAVVCVSLRLYSSGLPCMGTVLSLCLCYSQASQLPPASLLCHG